MINAIKPTTTKHTGLKETEAWKKFYINASLTSNQEQEPYVLRDFDASLEKNPKKLARFSTLMYDSSAGSRLNEAYSIVLLPHSYSSDCWETCHWLSYGAAAAFPSLIKLCFGRRKEAIEIAIFRVVLSTKMLSNWDRRIMFSMEIALSEFQWRKLNLKYVPQRASPHWLFAALHHLHSML